MHSLLLEEGNCLIFFMFINEIKKNKFDLPLYKSSFIDNLVSNLLQKM